MATKLTVPLPLLLALAVLLIAGIGFGAWGAWRFWFADGAAEATAGGPEAGVEEEQAELYRCPMHPNYTSDQPGSCPICGMDLVPVEPAAVEEPVGREHQGHVDAGVAASQAALYTCPMHPQIVEAEPGSCPLCGMDLVQVEPEPDMEMVETVHAEHTAPPGYATINVSADRRQLIGVRTATARTIDLSRTIRTVGVVAIDESGVVHVHSKVSGWIERAFVNVTGEQVRRGEPLLSIYSPELVSAQEEYLLALRARERLSGSEVREIMTGGSDLVALTRRRLELWDITDEEIARVEERGEPLRTLTLYAPSTGFVTELRALDGMYIGPETELYTLADLSRVWVLADVYESDLPFVQVGQEARLAFSYLPDRTFVSRVDYIYPVLDSRTRTAKVRFVFPNADLELMPEMYVNVELIQSLGRRLTVPQDAVLDTGEMQVVFVDLGDGRLQPRRVTVGPRVEGYVVIAEGISEGERVVTSANFLIDSESRTRAALEAISSGGDEEPGNQHRH